VALAAPGRAPAPSNHNGCGGIGQRRDGAGIRLAVALIGLTVLMWRRSNTAGRAVPRAKSLLRPLATAFALLTVIVLVVDAANVSTALNPDPALWLVFGG
jgi:hypothetical protein